MKVDKIEEKNDGQTTGGFYQGHRDGREDVEPAGEQHLELPHGHLQSKKGRAKTFSGSLKSSPQTELGFKVRLGLFGLFMGI